MESEVMDLKQSKEIYLGGLGRIKEKVICDYKHKILKNKNFKNDL